MNRTAIITRGATVTGIAIADSLLHDGWSVAILDTDEDALVEAARRHGVLVSPGGIYYPSEPPGPHLRLSHTAVTHLAEIGEGVRRLAAALADQASAKTS